MLVQTPSKIFKSDFRTWKEGKKHAVTQILAHEDGSGPLVSVCEAVLEVDGELSINSDGDRTFMILPLYGQVIVNDFYEPVSAGESLTFSIASSKKIVIRNHVYHDKADILIFEFKKQSGSTGFVKTELELEMKNQCTALSASLDIPNFIGLFDGRNKAIYTLKSEDKTIFGIVLNGAFEFQNRLMENRDAIMLWELQKVEFEALSENALVLFLEI